MAAPLRIISKVRNNRLMEIREELGMSVREFAEYVGLSYTYYNTIENLKQYPGRVAVEKLIDKLGSRVEDAFPEYLKDIKSNTSVKKLDESEMLSLQEAASTRLLETPEDIQYRKERDEKIRDILSTIRPVEARILRMRFGLDGSPEMSLTAVAAEIGCSRDRIRQLEVRALRRLRHPARAEELREWYEE